MEELKTLFGDGSLSYDEFEQRLSENEKTIKLGNLRSGNFVDKDKYEKAEKNANDWKTKYETLCASAGDYETLKNDYETLKAEADTLKSEKELQDKMKLVKGASVKDEFAEFVYSKVNSQVTEEKDFQTVLSEYVKDHAQYLDKKGTYANLQFGTTPQKNDNEKMNDIIRGYVK